jgi:anti-sigma B factor antagonist
MNSSRRKPVAALSLDITSDGASRIAIVVAGEVDMATAPQLDDCLSVCADADITVDLSQCGFLDSSGLSVLIRAYRAASAAGHTLRTTGEPDHILKVMEIAGLAHLFHGEDTDESS